MCCNRRNNKRTSIVAKMVQDRLINNSRAAHNEPVITNSRAAQIEPSGPPPAYEQIEQDPKAITPSKEIHATAFINNEELSPEYTTRDVNINSLSNNTTMASVRPTCQSRCAAKREKKQLKREIRQEHRLEKHQYRQEKRELRAEHRFEKKELRRAHGGPISMLIQGVSNLMKQ
ncbi:hypothetical protein E4T50_08360 [Aureobasidium sp. EXF-12298]|jgi:hypothetical protein|nr:hypothetical protein E4T50_08360 [Aureobasidium sp. EXF-12298]